MGIVKGIMKLWKLEKFNVSKNLKYKKRLQHVDKNWKLKGTYLSNLFRKKSMD